MAHRDFPVSSPSSYNFSPRHLCVLKWNPFHSHISPATRPVTQRSRILLTRRLASAFPFWSLLERKKSNKWRKKIERKIRAHEVLWKGCARIIKIRENLLIRSRLPFLLPYCHKFPSHEIAICCQLSWIWIGEVTFWSFSFLLEGFIIRFDFSPSAFQFLIRLTRRYLATGKRWKIACWEHVLIHKHWRNLDVEVLKFSSRNIVKQLKKFSSLVKSHRKRFYLEKILFPYQG